MGARERNERPAVLGEKGLTTSKSGGIPES